MLSTTFAFSGSRNAGSGGGKFRFELVALALANEGSGDITTVESTRRLISTIVVFPQLEHLNCTFVWPPNCQIGRASCRERVEISVGGVSRKKKREQHNGENRVSTGHEARTEQRRDARMS